jgi:seryl-tRNA synthetase
MIDIKAARRDPERFAAGIERKGGRALFEDLLGVDAAWREATVRVEQLRAATRPRGRPSEAELTELSRTKIELRAAEAELGAIEARRDALLLAVPNPADPEIPDGGEDDALELRRCGAVDPTRLALRDHLELGHFEVERAVRLSGSRFVYRMGQTALIELALYRHALEVIMRYGFLAVLPPVLVRREAMVGTGFLPTDEVNIYRTERDDLYLSGTSEVALAGLHLGEILEEDDLPLRYGGYSTNFRREAGAAGRDQRGILRLHQFDKVEMFSFVEPEQSKAEHDQILSIEEEIVASLGLAYRVVVTAAGDLGAPAAKKYDIEAYIPSEGRYREITSCSNTTDYQARRLGTRYRTRTRELSFPHTLNGTAMTARFLIALLEQHQEPDGSVPVPEPLWAFGAPTRLEHSAGQKRRLPPLRN